MRSMTVSTDTSQSKTLMDYISVQNLVARQRNRLWQAEGMAYLLAILAHFAVLQIYKTMPPRSPESELTIIEARLIVETPPAASAPAAVAPEPPKVEAKPPPPIPKLEKPIPKKIVKPILEPKPAAKPKPILKPVARPSLRARQELPEEAESRPSPVHEPAYEAPSAPVEAPRAVHRTPPVQAVPAESTEYHPGHVSGFGRNNYPRAAKERGWEGTVTLKVHIRSDGDIGEVIVVGSSGHDMLDEAAVDMVKEAHASPARRGDKPVDSWVVVPYRFHLEH